MMKHPLTSKERRGLVAVAAAALLCIASGFIFRSCSSFMNPSPRTFVPAPDSISAERNSLEPKEDLKKNKENKKKGSKKKKSIKNKNGRKDKKPSKTYPTREPLSQPCD